jgi:cysteine desulfurase/selenocysteine lyase
MAQGTRRKAGEALDVTAVRRDFPILEREVHGKPLVYLDNAATSQKPRQVIAALTEYYERYNANIHRAVHALGEEATAAYEVARDKVRRFVNAPDAESVIFTRNTTEAINLVAYAWGRANIGEGDEIILTQMEHHSNLVPWLQLAKEKGATIRYIEITPEGTLDLSKLGRLFGRRTKLLAMPHVSNSLGTINPAAELVAEARRRGVVSLVDGAQATPHMAVDLQALDADFYAFSSHKMLGPTGIGVLYGRRSLLEEMSPFLGGGEMIRKVTFEEATWNDLPWKFEAGTPNVADAIAFGAAIDYLEALGMDNVRRHEVDITAYALDRLRTFDDITLYGPDDPERRGGVVSFNFGDLHPHDVGTILDRHGVAIRAGHHCTQPLMRCLGVSGTARASFYIYNTEEEVDVLVEALKAARDFFR